MVWAACNSGVGCRQFTRQESKLVGRVLWEEVRPRLLNCLDTYRQGKHWYFTLTIALSMAGLFLSPVAYSVLLLDLAFKLENLRTIFKAVELRIIALSQAVMFTVLVTYVFSVIGFYAYRDHYATGAYAGCGTLADCAMRHFYFGLRRDQTGFLEPLTDFEPKDVVERPVYLLRIVIDFLNWFMLTFTLFSILRAIILDAFGTMRSKKYLADNSMETKCLMCHLDRCNSGVGCL